MPTPACHVQGRRFSPSAFDTRRTRFLPGHTLWMMSNGEPLDAGTVAPDFRLPAALDQDVTLSNLRGKPVILAFYPAD